MHPELSLFAAAQPGDPVALERMLRELQPEIRRYAGRQCHRTIGLAETIPQRDGVTRSP